MTRRSASSKPLTPGQERELLKVVDHFKRYGDARTVDDLRSARALLRRGLIELRHEAHERRVPLSAFGSFAHHARRVETTTFAKPTENGLAIASVISGREKGS